MSAPTIIMTPLKSNYNQLNPPVTTVGEEELGKGWREKEG